MTRTPDPPLRDAEGNPMESHHVPHGVCPGCRNRADGATGAIAAPKGPAGGDFAPCWYCGDLNRYDLALKLRPTTEDDWTDFPPDQRGEVERMQANIQERIADERADHGQ